MIKRAPSLLLTVALLAVPLAGCSSLSTVNIPLNGASTQAAPAPERAAPPWFERANIFAEIQAPAQDAPIDTSDDVTVGKRHFAATNYGLAEQHFRRAVEKPTGPKTRDIEAWLGLAASYDRLRRFELADRAYGQAIATIGPTPEILNNQGYSFLLRRDFRNARKTLQRAYEKDPGNSTIQSNLALLDETERLKRPVR
jgi:Flp pilus assembly protein TadD